MRYAPILACGGMALACALFSGCAGGSVGRSTEGRGGKHYGGVFNANEGEDLRGLFPLSLTQAASHRIATQIYEGLVGFDQADLSIRPAIASTWTLDPAGMVYTFTIRKGVFFHDDECFPNGKGREVKAQDVAYCFTQLCTADEQNLMGSIFQGKVLGAEEYFRATEKRGKRPKGGVEGIEVLDDHTLRITLVSPSPSFLQILAHQGCWIYPREMVDHYGPDARWNPVGTGAFKMKSFRRGEALILERNPVYWGEDEHGNQLPFLDAIRYTFTSDKDRELNEFLKGNLSLVFELPVDRTDVLESARNYIIQDIPAYSVQFYGFNQRIKPFNDVRVRQAFSLAVDRRLLVDSVLKGYAIPAERGMVAPGFKDYPYDSIPPLRYDPDRARELLAKAGYPDGRGMPTIFLQVNNDGFGYVHVAAMVQAMLERELGARVVTSVLPVKQHFERIERGEAAFWREGWIVDHPDPENVLALCHGRNAPKDIMESSFMNTTRYHNAVFDGWFGQAQRIADHKSRMHALARAERQLMKDAAVMPLYHERSIRLIQPYVRDLPINAMEYRDLRGVWFDPSVKGSRVVL